MRERLTWGALLVALAGLGAGVALAWGGVLALRGGPPAPPAPPPGAAILPPLRLLSLGVPVRASSGQAAVTVDGQWRTWAGWRPDPPTAAAPQWLALDLGRGPGEILLLWNAGNNINYDETRYGGLGAYEVQTSADSTDGADGGWISAVVVPTNTVRTRSHRLPFSGQRWVRLWVTALPPEAESAALDEVAVYDATRGVRESWIFLGDSITALALDRAAPRGPAFADLIQAARPATVPAMINAGRGSATAADGLRQIDALLARHPDFHYWVLAYGTNDVLSDPDATQTAAFIRRVGTMAARIKAAGHVPILSLIPYSRDPRRGAIPQYNAALRDLAAGSGLALGPDLYTYFRSHPAALSADGVHPTDAGAQAINRLWAEWRLNEVMSDER